MRNFLSAIVLFFIICNLDCKAGPFDTGMTTLEQPNNVTFTGRMWGDEFIHWAETDDGYTFIQSTDGWYYYATLNAQGEYAPTIYKVGMDSPPAYSYHLERSQTRLDEIVQQIQDFNEAVEMAGERFAQEQAEANEGVVNRTIGIILIQFPDFPRFEDEYRPQGYLKSDFEKMMFSENDEWYDPNPFDGTPHPENEAIFGSFKEYWHQISKGKLLITGEVVNPADENGVIEWLDADYDRTVYIEFGPYDRLANEAIGEAVSREWISLEPGHPKYKTNLVVVFAGPVMDYPNLFTHADPDRYYIQIAERSSKELWQGEVYTFTHMGVYAHEFGHNLGFYDEYKQEAPPPDGGVWQEEEDGGTDTYNFDLMSWGIYNGPLRKGECPATLSPYYRIIANWISSTTLPDDENNFIAEYNYEYPKVYRINPISAIEDEHFLFESRGRDGFDKFIPWDPNNPTPQPGNLIVWYHNMKFVHPLTGAVFTDRSRIISADDTRDWSSLLTDFFPSTFNPITQDFNDISTPATTMGYLISGSDDGNDRPANFALNGIQKHANGSTLINEIILYHPLKIKNEITGSWQTVSVPHILTDYSVQAVFPTLDPNSSVYKYQSSYIQVSTLENGPGYWAKFYPGNQDLVFEGVLISYLEIPVVLGWQITGSISYLVPLSNLQTNPPGIINSTIYRFDETYQAVTDYIKPGVGYWVKTSAPGYLILDKDAQQGETEEIRFDIMDKFTITDAEDNTQTLYVSNIDLDTLIVNINTEMPPLFPELTFDSRFEYGELVKKVSADSGLIDINILVQTNAFPVSLSWEINPENGINYSFVGDTTLGKLKEIESISGKVSFDKLNNNKIQLLANVDGTNSKSLLPTEFVLYQNYPNPFNPVTTIKYDIVKAQDVKVTVFDILGIEIATLVNEQQQPGSYQVKWDASNASSGIYFYQLRTKDFVGTKKMIILK